MNAKICNFYLAIMILILALFSGACATPDVTGTNLIIGIEKEPIDFQNVQIYITDNCVINFGIMQLYSESNSMEKELKKIIEILSISQVPDIFEYVAYIEGIKQVDFEDIKWSSYRMLIKSEEVRLDALEQIKINAARLGANGIILTSIDYENGKIDDLMCVASGWAIYVPEDGTTLISRKKNKAKEKCDEFQTLIELPEQYETLGNLSAKQEFRYLHTGGKIAPTPNRVIETMVDELKKEVKKLNGNALYIKEIIRKEESHTSESLGLFGEILDVATQHYIVDPIMERVDPEKYPCRISIAEAMGGKGCPTLGVFSSSGDVFFTKYYIITAKAIKVHCNN
jgi:uncharacterized protein YbjQ (UPF0145 family)